MNHPRAAQLPSGAGNNLVRRAHVDRCDADAVAWLAARLGPQRLQHVFLFVSSEADFDAVSTRAREVFGDVPVSACTTAGEIGPEGYGEGGILAVGFPASHFAVETVFVAGLDDLGQRDLVGDVMTRRHQLAARHPDWRYEFAFSLIDGLSLREEAVLLAIAPGLGGMPLFGGSAGDGQDFGRTWVSFNGDVHQNAALIAVIRTRCPVKVFSLDHFVPTTRQLVVTKADAERRMVLEINAAPAAGEYARALGVRADQLSESNFAAHPLVVRIAQGHHVRAILQQHDNGALEFASAIDEGVVLTLADAGDITQHLSDNLDRLATSARPDVVLACDCLWRKIEIENRQATRTVSALLRDHRVLGFNSYGEQLDALHVNHTMTGVAIYPPLD
ncbi:MAG: FIST N-terminal domain-containing protein [Sedimentitalea sp.]